MSSNYVLGIQYEEMPDTKLYLVVISKLQTSFENVWCDTCLGSMGDIKVFDTFFAVCIVNTTRSGTDSVFLILVCSAPHTIPGTH